MKIIKDVDLDLRIVLHCALIGIVLGVLVATNLNA